MTRPTRWMISGPAPQLTVFTPVSIGGQDLILNTQQEPGGSFSRKGERPPCTPCGPLSRPCLTGLGARWRGESTKQAQPFVGTFSGQRSEAHSRFSKSWAPRPQTNPDLACL